MKTFVAPSSSSRNWCNGLTSRVRLCLGIAATKTVAQDDPFEWKPATRNAASCWLWLTLNQYHTHAYQYVCKTMYV